MVQFGKTENNEINNTTNSDTSRNQTAYILDKTSQHILSVKDIITITNNYKNMDITILAATMALSIATPLINGLIQKAINKWNDEIPPEMQDDANREMALIKGKCERLGRVTYGGLITQENQSSNITAEDFLVLQGKVNDHMCKLTDTASGEIIEGFCKKDKDRVERAETMLHDLNKVFGISIRSAVQHQPSSSMIGDFKYDHALECLSRILPSSMICDSSSFLVRKMITVTHINQSDAEVKELEEKLDSFYIVKSVKCGEESSVVQLMPREQEISVQMLSILYDIDLTLISNAHFFSMRIRQPWYLAVDPNLSIEAILETKLGHSISVLGEVIGEVSLHVSSILRERNPHDNVQNLFLLADKGPFKCKVKMTQFGNPLSLFNVRTDDDLLPLDKNFKVMGALIRVVGTIKVHYPSLLRRGDTLLHEYIYRAKMASDTTYLARSLPSAPTFSLGRFRRGASTIAGGSSSRDPSPMVVPAGRVYPDLPVTPAMTISGLDTLLMTMKVKDYTPTDIRRLVDLPEALRKQLKKEHRNDAFTVIRLMNASDVNHFKIRLTNTEQVNEILGETVMRMSYEFRNQVYYLRGDKLFDNKCEFRSSIIEPDIEQPVFS